MVSRLVDAALIQGPRRNLSLPPSNCGPGAYGGKIGGNSSWPSPLEKSPWKSLSSPWHPPGGESMPRSLPPLSRMKELAAPTPRIDASAISVRKPPGASPASPGTAKTFLAKRKPPHRPRKQTLFPFFPDGREPGRQDLRDHRHPHRDDQGRGETPHRVPGWQNNGIGFEKYPLRRRWRFSGIEAGKGASPGNFHP